MKFDDHHFRPSPSRSRDARRGPPPRFIEAPTTGDPVRRAIAEEIRAVCQPRPLKREERLRIQMRLRASTRPRAPGRLRPALIGVLIFLLGGTVGAAIVQRVGLVRMADSDRHREPAPAVSPASRPRSSAHRPLPVAPVVTVASPAPPPPAKRVGGAHLERGASPDHARTGLTAENQRSTEGDVPGDQQLIATALLQLRHDGDAAAALRSLDDYERRYPGGLLAVEAALARADALLALGRANDALTVLDGVSFTGAVRAEELQTLRGELRAAHSRCSDAVSDFDVVIARGRPALQERALFGRAGCRARLGDDSGARADLDVCIARFPRGRCIDQTRRAPTP